MSKKWKKVCIYLFAAITPQSSRTQMQEHGQKLNADSPWDPAAPEAELRWHGVLPAPAHHRGRQDGQNSPAASGHGAPLLLPLQARAPHHTRSRPRSEVSGSDVHLSTDRMLKDKVRYQLSKLKPGSLSKWQGRRRPGSFPASRHTHTLMFKPHTLDLYF